jgi:hypothetical protein
VGLYLCIFRSDEPGQVDEIDGVEVGSYADFGTWRDAVASLLEQGEPGRRFPVFMTHSDCDGSWSPAEAAVLRVELAAIAAEFARLAPVPLEPPWKQLVARSTGLHPTSLRDCFFDVDGESLFDRLDALCARSIEAGLPILFQ